MGKYIFLIIFVIALRCSIVNANKWSLEQTIEDCTALATDERSLLVFSTLGGGLIAIDPISNEIRWAIEDEPVIKAEAEPHSPLPRFLPNPKDGSLYQLNRKGDLKKLPYTVPQLVANAPCRSSDGILYSGTKSDSWYLIDPKTGYREKVMGFIKTEKNEKVEELENGKIGWTTSCSIYLGRTQYTVMMLDTFSKNKNLKPWNITFYDYSSHVMAPELSNDYGFIHLTASSSGVVATLNKQGSLLWKKDLGSPIISLFLLRREGLFSVPFTTVADNVLEDLVKDSIDETSEIKLSQSIYIGEYSNGFYALPSLVDEDTARLTSVHNMKLLEGPETKSDPIKPNSIYITDYSILGHHNLQSKGTLDLQKLNQWNVESNIKQIEVEKSDIIKENDSCQINENNYGLSNSNHINTFLNETITWFPDCQSDTIFPLLLLITLFIVTLFWYVGGSLNKFYNQNVNKFFNKKLNVDITGIAYRELKDLGNGQAQVGKIIFDSHQILGKGCEGTFVFRGSFEKRNVAVKRLLPECFTFADREVALLRESDTHENVVRYFCTEQDRQFRYIALELCAATLQDLAEGIQSEEFRSIINVWEVLKQATSGLSHLHSLSIAHRDIKPQNVLLSFPDANNIVRAMISDFGLCKKLSNGSKSFSQHSGVTGTEGWIAPEMLLGKRVTTAVDIFSLGCVFFYVLSKGHHAFGDTLRRQANILTNEYDLTELHLEKSEGPLKSKLILAEQLIVDMLQYESEKRPDARAICDHPLFWNEEKVLAFLQDVSDRVEKLSFDVEPLSSLEINGCVIIYKDWILSLETEITNDLKKYRGYIGASVRDLLRALRNKKHHYHELSLEAKKILGSAPKEFTNYWISKFPYLLQHTYHSLSYCSTENIFKYYYNQTYLFSKPSYFNQCVEGFRLGSHKLNSNLINSVKNSNKINKKFSYKKSKNAQKFVKSNINNTTLNASEFLENNLIKSI